ncbi:MAG: alpha/beta fold hydrolase [Nonlabens sp.]
MMQIIEQVVAGENGRKMPVTVRYQEKSDSRLPVILFCHGFKGFKDWGAWNLMGSAFAKAGYLFISFNYSHNGGTIQDPIDFPDLEAFGNNNYSIELRDTIRILDWITSSQLPVDSNKLYLMGHSRAGGIATLVASRDHRLSGLITLAGVACYRSRFPREEALELWEEQGVYYIKNGRTQQSMPLYYQFFQDFQLHENNLDIKKAASKLAIPHLIIHGTLDPTVNFTDAVELSKSSPHSELLLLPGANHVFGACHPWESTNLPPDLKQVVQCALNWLSKTTMQ